MKQLKPRTRTKIYILKRKTNSMLGFIIDIIIFIIAAIPLYFAVKTLNGKTTFLNTVLVNIITGIMFTVMRNTFPFLGVVFGFILLIWIYHEVFRLKWFKAFVAWILQFVFIALFYFILFLIATMLGLLALANAIPFVFIT